MIQGYKFLFALDTTKYTVSNVKQAFEEHPRIQPCQELTYDEFLTLSIGTDSEIKKTTLRSYRSYYQPFFQNHNNLFTEIIGFIRRMCKSDVKRECPSCHRKLKFFESHAICLHTDLDSRMNCGNQLNQRIASPLHDSSEIHSYFINLNC